MKRKVIAVWKGDGADGSGVLTAQSGAFSNMPYSFKTSLKMTMVNLELTQRS